jgi:DNA-binding PadR family transcriptional regulator
VSLGAGTLYGALSTLVQKGWIAPCGGESGDRKKEYTITTQGRNAVEAEISRLEELLDNGRAVTGGTEQ